MNDKRISLYPVGGINISDLLREAHPQGGPIIGGDKEGKVEDSIEAQIKNLESFYKKPAVITLAQLAERLEAVGAIDLAEQIDKVASGLFHKSALIKRAELTKNDIINSARKIEQDISRYCGRDFIMGIPSLYPFLLFISHLGQMEYPFRTLDYVDFLISRLNKMLVDISTSSFSEKLNDYAISLFDKLRSELVTYRKETRQSIPNKKSYYEKMLDSKMQQVNNLQLFAQSQSEKVSATMSEEELEAKINDVLNKYKPRILSLKKNYDFAKNSGEDSFTENNMNVLDQQLSTIDKVLAQLQSELKGVV